MPQSLVRPTWQTEKCLPENLEFDLGIPLPCKKHKKLTVASSEALGIYSSIRCLNDIGINLYEAEIVYRQVRRGRRPKLDTPDGVFRYLGDVPNRYPVTETFWTIMLDRKNYAIARYLCSQGILSSALAHPREVFRSAILCSAASVIVAHNHPSGDPTPSAADIMITRQLREAARVVDIGLLDHVIIGVPEHDPNRRGFYSFREAGLI